MEDSYCNLKGMTSTGKYMGLKPDNDLGPRKVFQVNKHGNKEIHAAIAELKHFTSNYPEVMSVHYLYLPF